MKQFVLLLTVVVVQFASAQRMTFNQIYEYQCHNGSPTCTHLVIANSDDRRYFGLMSTGAKNTQISVMDIPAKTVHVFKIDLSKSDLNNPETFIYQFSTDKVHTPANEVFCEFELISEDSAKAEYRIVHYKNKRKKTVNYEYRIEMEKSSDDQFDAFRLAIMHPYEYDTEYRPPITGKVVKGSWTYQKRKMETRLKEISTTTITIDIPQEQIPYERSALYREQMADALFRFKQSPQYKGGTIKVSRGR